MPQIIGGPKITDADKITGEYVADLRIGNPQPIKIYNDTAETRDWHIAMPLNMPAWLIIDPDHGTLLPGGPDNETVQITVKVETSDNPPSVSVKFGWNPPFEESTDNTLVVNIV